MNKTIDEAPAVSSGSSLTINVPNDCVLPGCVIVSLIIPCEFFAPNPEAGTKVVFSVATNVDTMPLEVDGYTIGVCVCVCVCPLSLTSTPRYSKR